MKIVYRYILKNFLKKFIPSFVIIYFIFVLQTFWLYFDELAGKGLDTLTIFKFLMYISPAVILNAIPLGVLLGGIMSFGSMSEQSEFTAMKSMGISLKSMLKSLSYFIVALAIGTFVFANTAYPYGQYKFSNLRRNIHQKMPSIAISEGMFNDFKPAGINIYVAKKYGKNNNKLEEVVIHQKVNGIPDKTIIAKNGLFKSDPSNHLIQLVLFDGAFYEDLTRQQKNTKDRKKFPAITTQFQKHVINIDVSDLDKVDLDATSVSSGADMLNVVDLVHQIDTLKLKNTKRRENFAVELIKRNQIKNKYSDSMQLNHQNIAAVLHDKNFFTAKDMHSIYSRLTNKSDALLMLAKRKKNYFQRQEIRSNKYIHALNEKFTFPLSVIIMFLVGIPLGAIIRKGGFGISIVFGIIIFITYYILSMIGKNASEEGAIPAFLGAWFAAIVLLPLGIYLSYKAHNDGEFTMLSNLFAKIKSFFSKKKTAIQ